MPWVSFSIHISDLPSKIDQALACLQRRPLLHQLWGMGSVFAKICDFFKRAQFEKRGR
jgi:hypothetical protein